MKKIKTLQQIANKQGISRQAVWLKTAKGKAYRKAYQKSNKDKAYRKAYQKSNKYKAYRKAYYKQIHIPISKLRKLGLIKS